MCIFSCFTIRVDNCDLVFRQFPGLVDVKVGEGVEVANFGAVHNSGVFDDMAPSSIRVDEENYVKKQRLESNM